MPTTLPLAAALMMREAGEQTVSRASQRRKQLDESHEDKHEKRRRRIDETQQQNAVALLAPTRPAQLELRSEQRIEVGSRTFRREAAVADGRRQFQQDQSAFRDALRSAREQATQAQSPNSPRGEAAGDGAAAKTANISGQTASGAAGASANDAKPGGSAPNAESVAAQAKPVAPNATSGAAELNKVAVAGQTSAQNSHVTTTTNAASGDAAAASAPNRSGQVGAAGVAGVSSSRPAAEVAPTGTQASESGASKSANRVESVASPSGGSSRAGERFDRTLGSGKSEATADADAAESRENIDRLLRMVRAQVVSGRGSTVLKLDPPNLGNLRVEINLQRDGLSVRMDPETEVAHRMLSQGIEDLRRDLRAAGIELAHVDIRPPSATTVVQETPAGWNPRQMSDQDDAATRRDDRDEQLDGVARTRARGREGLTRGTDAAASTGMLSVSMDASQGPTAESRVNVLA